ncbi:sensor domain-containing diguanylate cyclase [Oceanospirillum sanctuarii]|uniref:sensor domain-containing diguanylate cyclase n=1 Tax=Oceanospirillum sanctuarii TaxID=1434821 RepID=UPI000A3742E0|nr:sensor domain-containing diguanylate cyclase [Oceanospirillum sanctuarii]
MELKDLDPKSLLEGLREGVVVHSATTEILYANPRALELLRLTEAQAMGKDTLDPSWRFVDSQNRLMTHQDFPVNRVISEGRSIANLEVGICDSSTAEVTWVLCNANPQFSSSGSIEHVIVSFIDITGMKSEISFESVVANSDDVVVITEADPIDEPGPRIVYVNNAFTRLSGYTREEVMGKNPRILQGPETSDDTRKRIRQGLENKDWIHERIQNFSKDGTPYWLDLKIFPLKNTYGQITHFAAIERDISDQVEKEHRLQELADRDPLTNLLNRRGFSQEVEHYLSQRHSELKGIVALIDIDFFKKINDSFGHECGDHALICLAEKLRNTFGNEVSLCRFGGEEFAIFFPGGELKSCLEKLDRFREQVARSPLQVAEDRTLTLTISIGLAQVKSGACFEEAVKVADNALYVAKKTGRNRVELQIGTTKASL